MEITQRTPINQEARVSPEDGCTAAMGFINRIGTASDRLQKMVLQVFDSYIRNTIGEQELSLEVVALLNGYPELLNGIGEFLPAGEVAARRLQKPCSRKIGDRGGDPRAELVQEQRVSKRMKAKDKSADDRPLLRWKRPEKETETTRVLSGLSERPTPSYKLQQEEKKPESPEAAELVQEQSAPKRAKAKAKAKSAAGDKPLLRVKRPEKETETRVVSGSSERLTPSYKLLPLQPEKTKTTSSVLNTSCVAVAAEDCDFAAGAERRSRRMKVDRREEMLNKMEDDLFEADMAKSHLMSAAKYAEEGGTENGNPMGKTHFKRCMEMMYGGEVAAEMEREADPDDLVRVVKTRLYQKIGECTVKRSKINAKEYLRRVAR